MDRSEKPKKGFGFHNESCNGKWWNKLETDPALEERFSKETGLQLLSVDSVQVNLYCKRRNFENS